MNNNAKNRFLIRKIQEYKNLFLFTSNLLVDHLIKAACVAVVDIVKMIFRYIYVLLGFPKNMHWVISILILLPWYMILVYSCILTAQLYTV